MRPARPRSAPWAAPRAQLTASRARLAGCALPAALAGLLVALVLNAPLARADSAAPPASPAPTTSPATATPPAPSSAGVGVEPFHARYLWSWHGVSIALSIVDFTHGEDDTWTYTSLVEPHGIGHLYPMRPHLQSVMRITAQGVTPLSFKATGSGRSHDADVVFDWENAHASGIYEGAKVDMSIQPGIQDDLSVQVAMLQQLTQGHMPDKVMEINKNSVREYDYARVGEQVLDTAIGRIPTIIYAIHAPGSPRTTRFWCAPSLGYIPLQAEQKRLDTVEWTTRIRDLKRG